MRAKVYSDSEKFIRKKERKKIIRTAIEVAVIIGVIVLVVYSLLNPKRYQPYGAAEVSDTLDTGFVSVSYFGVERFKSESKSLVDMDTLNEHLSALRDSGFITITQDDIEAYYEKDVALPTRALFLMFEDGRRDTAIFAQSVLEANNYIATMLSYADKFEMDDTKFLKAGDLKEIASTTFWELGTNGYRLEYINAYDRYGNFYGHLNSNQFTLLSKFMSRNYNHYLMDYIRDKDQVPTESIAQMKSRIASDYESAEEVYTRDLGYLPKLYVLMHSNTGQFGTNDTVSAENELHMKELFTMNFNREGYSKNDKTSSMYDLTRMQPQGHWSVNHLLMRIWDDTGMNMAFRSGLASEAANWKQTAGVAEYKEGEITLTSLPKARGLITLARKDFSDCEVSVRLLGNVLGRQKIYLRANDDMSDYLSVSLETNVLYVREAHGGAETDLYSINLVDLFGGPDISIDEDEFNSLISEQEAIIKYSDSQLERARARTKKAEFEAQKASVATIKDGADGYYEEIDLLDRGDHNVKIALSGDKISVFVDDTQAVNDMTVSVLNDGALALEAEPDLDYFSQRNLYDDVYDGVFRDLSVKTIAADGTATTEMYDGSLNFIERAWLDVRNAFMSVINWFVKNL